MAIQGAPELVAFCYRNNYVDVEQLSRVLAGLEQSRSEVQSVAGS